MSKDWLPFEYTKIQNEMIPFHEINWEKVSKLYAEAYMKKEFTPITLTDEMLTWEIQIGYKNNNEEEI